MNKYYLSTTNACRWKYRHINLWLKHMTHAQTLYDQTMFDNKVWSCVTLFKHIWLHFKHVWWCSMGIEHVKLWSNIIKHVWWKHQSCIRIPACDFVVIMWLNKVVYIYRYMCMYMHVYVYIWMYMYKVHNCFFINVIYIYISWSHPCIHNILVYV